MSYLDNTMILSLIGNISLNISFVLYLVVYAPQIIHNQKGNNIRQLSVWLHFLLFLSYFFDLIYGFSSHFPWQYKVVSIVGLLLVNVQYLQLIRFFIQEKRLCLATCSLLFFILCMFIISCFFIILKGHLDVEITFVLGVFARGFGLLYCLPQILKNKILKSANAINLHFIYLNLAVAILDAISAWCLNWGWPNKLASPLTMCLMIILLNQIKKYGIKPRLSIHSKKLGAASSLH